MSFFTSESEEKDFNRQLIDYLNLQQEYEIASMLHDSKIEYTWFSIDSDFNGLYNNYILGLKIRMPLYIKLKDRFKEIGDKIHKAATNLISGRNQNRYRIRTVSFFVEEVTNNQTSDKEDLLTVVEKVKSNLIAKATGEYFNEREYTINRRILLGKQSLNVTIPEFVKNNTNLDEFRRYIQPKYPTYKQRYNYIVEEFKPLISLILNPERSPLHANINQKLTKLDSESIRYLWSKAISRLNGDPDGAITAASTLLENTIKSIMNDLKVEYSDEKDKLPKLYGLLASKLNLSPSQHIDQILKQILGGCHSIIQGLGSLRNKIGDAHAPGKRPVKPTIRHAELSVNLSGTMATFLIATWENNKLKK
ncbi:MAG: abortive infection family protein [Candidatus Rickettsiella isopodorum]|jgi:hypothetical protein